MKTECVIERPAEKLSINISFAATSKRLFVMTVLNFFTLIKAVHLESISSQYDLYRQRFMAFNIF